MTNLGGAGVSENTDFDDEVTALLARQDRLNPLTLAVWQADPRAQLDDVVTTAEYFAGTGGGGTGDVIASGTENGASIVVHNTLPLSWALRKTIPAIAEAYGLIGDNAKTNDAEMLVLLAEADDIDFSAGIFKFTRSFDLDRAIKISGLSMKSTILRFWGDDGLIVKSDGVQIENLELFGLDVNGIPDPKDKDGLVFDGTGAAKINFCKVENVSYRGWRKGMFAKYLQQTNITGCRSVFCLVPYSSFGQTVNITIDNCMLVADSSANSVVVETVKDGAIKGEGLMISNSLLAGGNRIIKSDGFLSLNVTNSTLDLCSNIAIEGTNIEGLLVQNNWIFSDVEAIKLNALGVEVDVNTVISGNYITATAGVKTIDIGTNNSGVKITTNTIKGDSRLLFLDIGAKRSVVTGNNFIQTGTGFAIFHGTNEGSIVSNNTGDSSIQYQTPNVARFSSFNNEGEGGFQVQGVFTVAPTAGTWKRGDIAWNLTPVAGGTVGFICVVAGTPGTWKAFGTIAV